MWIFPQYKPVRHNAIAATRERIRATLPLNMKKRMMLAMKKIVKKQQADFGFRCPEVRSRQKTLPFLLKNSIPIQ
jgi:hypothetical protein